MKKRSRSPKKRKLFYKKELKQFLSQINNKNIKIKTKEEIKEDIKVKGNLCGNKSLLKYLIQSLKTKKIIDYILLFSKNKEEELCGILIAMLDECHKDNKSTIDSSLQNIWSLRIICSNKKGFGKIMVGAFIYSLLCRKEEGSGKYDKTILDVANGYKNGAALHLYKKFGYKINTLMNCYEYNKIENTQYGNLKMDLNLNNIEKEKIILIINEI